MYSVYDCSVRCGNRFVIILMHLCSTGVTCVVASPAERDKGGSGGFAEAL